MTSFETSSFRSLIVWTFIFYYLKCSFAATTELQRESCADMESTSDMPSDEEFNTARKALGAFRSRNFALDSMHDPSISYPSTLVTSYAALVIMAIIGIVILILGSMSLFFSHRIKCFQRDLAKDPYSKCSMIASIVSVVLFSITLVVLSIIGLVSSEPNDQSMNSAICNTLNLAEHLSDGGITNSDWIGTGQIATALSDIATLYSSTASYFAVPFVSSTFLTTVSTLQAQITNMQTSLPSTLVVPLPNPQRTSVPVYVQPDLLALLGTQSDLNTTTVLGSLEWEYQNKIDLETMLLQKLSDSSDVLATQTATISSGFTTDEATSNSFHNRVNSFRNFLNLEMEQMKHYNDVSSGMGSAMYGLGIAFGIIGVLATFMMIWCKLMFSRFALSASWVIISIGEILLFTSAAISYASSVSIMESCEGISYIVNDSTLFDKYINFINLPELKTCFFDDGDLPESLAIQTEIILIDEVASDMTNVDNNSDLYEEDLSLRYINYWIDENDAYLAFTQNGIEIAANSAYGLDSYDSPPVTLDELNSWSNYEYQTSDSRENAQYGISCGALSRDAIVFTASFCGTSVSSCDTTSPVGDPCCIILNEAAFDVAFITMRLTRVVPANSCSSLSVYKSKYLEYFTSLKDYTTNLVSILDTQVAPLFATYETDTDVYLRQVNTLYQDVQDNLKPYSDALSAKTATFSAETNCLFLQNDIKLMHEALCHSYMIRSYDSAKYLILNACIFFLTSISYYYAIGRIPSFIQSLENANRLQTLAGTEYDEILGDQDKQLNQSTTTYGGGGAADNSMMMQQYPEYAYQTVTVTHPTGVLENLRHNQMNMTTYSGGEKQLTQQHNREMVPLPSDNSHMNNRTSRLTQAKVNAQNPMLNQAQTSINSQQTQQTRVEGVYKNNANNNTLQVPSATSKPTQNVQAQNKFNNVFDESDELDDFGMDNGNSGTNGKLPPKSVIRQQSKRM